MDWHDVYIFISSTFNDMHAERDYLVKNVFPELTEWCEKHKLRLIDIDLRWGITSADSEAKNTVRSCLKNIDKCRPFFLCFLGQRRGWVPNDPLCYEFKKKNNSLSLEQLEKGKLDEISEISYKDYEKLKNYDGKASVTEMEIEHALLSPMLNLKPSDHALFFFRNHDFENDGLTENQRMIYLNDELKKYDADPKIADDALKAFKDKIRNHWKKVTEYTCKWMSIIPTPELLAEKDGNNIAQGRLIEFKVNDLDLKDVVIEKLKNEIKEQFKDHFEQSTTNTIEKTSFEIAYQNDLEQQKLFIRIHSDGYIPREKITGKLDEYINNDTDNYIFLLIARAGLGKTMLLANYVKQLTDNKRTVYARFCGVSDLSSEQYSLWKSIFHEAGVTVPDTLNELRQKIGKLLEELSQQGDIVVIIDAVNQIQEGLNIVEWLPKKLPSGLKIIVSLKENDESHKLIRSLGLKKETLSAFESKAERVQLIQNFLDRYFKALDDNHIDAICNLPSTNNPLFLKVLLHELRMFGAFKQLNEKINQYGDDPQKAFTAILERLESDPAYDVITPKESVPFLFGLLAYAKKGLSEDELVACFSKKFKLNKNDDKENEKMRSTVRFYLRQVRPFMAHREGRSDFLYESFMIAAKERYKNNETCLQRTLSECFLSFCDPVRNGLFETKSSRALIEYAYHLGKYNVSDAEQLYCNIPYLNIRCSICSVGELLTEYGIFTQSTVQQYYNVIFRYSQTLSEYENALFSILYYSGFEHAKQQIVDLLSKGKWNKPWIGTKLLYQINDVHENSEKALSFHKLAENELPNTVAVQTVRNKNIAFYSEGNGRIRSVDTLTLVSHDTVIRTLPVRPMNITASDDGTWLAVGYDDATVEIIRLQFNEKNILYLSESIRQLSYFLPMYDNGVFGFNDHFFWYQKDEKTLIKTDIGGEKSNTEIHLEHPGELSSILFVQNNAVFSIRQSDRTVFIALRVDSLDVLATRYLEYADITAYIPLNDNRIAVSTNNNRLLIFNEHLEEQTSVTFDAPVVAAVTYKTQLFLILKNTGNKLHGVLWNFTTDSKSDIPLDNTISLVSQISVKQHTDNSLFLISEYVLCKFILSSENAVPQKTEIIAVDYRAEQDSEDIDVSGLVIVTKKDKYFTIIHDDITKRLPEEFNSPDYMVLFASSEVYTFNFGNGYMLSLDDTELTPVDLNSHLNIACTGKDNYLYFYDAAGNLRCLQSGFSMDLSAYKLISASLYSLDNYILLAGSADNAECGMRKETGYESAPHIVLFYEISTNGQLNFLGKRYFLESKGKIVYIANSPENNWLYLAFRTPNTGKTKEPPVIRYGTIDDFLSQREKEKVVPCRKEDLSMACVNNSLLVCSYGIITRYNIYTLEYEATTVAEKPFQYIRQTKGFSSDILAVCGKNEITRMIINQ
jgi:hypothetical protein